MYFTVPVTKIYVTEEKHKELTYFRQREHLEILIMSGEETLAKGVL